MSGRSSVAMRMDGDATIGIGHVRRCLVLAHALREHGYDVTLVRRQRIADAAHREPSRFATRWLEDAGWVPTPGGTNQEEADAEATLALVGRAADAQSWAVVDHYDLGWDWERRIRAAGYRILAIDDFRDRRHAADVLVSDSPEPFVPALNEPAGGVSLAGFPYALIDRAYAANGDLRYDPQEPPRLLVTFGGSDPTRETEKICEALHRLRQTGIPRTRFGDVDVVIGPANPLRHELSELTARFPWARIQVAPPILAPLMRGADLVITSGGNTLVEALALRKPCLVIVTADNQQLMVEELRVRRLIRVAGVSSGLGSRDLECPLEEVLGELPSFGAEVHQQSCFDLGGAGRIAAAMRAVEEQR